MQAQEPWHGMPSTRFQGSKKKLLSRLHPVFSGLEFETCLDAFGGTGSVSFLLKQMGKRVAYNDVLPSNVEMAKALFANAPVELDEAILTELFVAKERIPYSRTIERIYRDVYFTDEENVQIDVYLQNSRRLASPLLRAEAFYVLAQSLLSKRPYNLFHRANLHMRLKDVDRSFGNKATWDKPIAEHARKFLQELKACRSRRSRFDVTLTNRSAFEIDHGYDLVYIDTPYAKSAGTQESNYFNFYHFLDALLAYDSIESEARQDLKHRPFYEKDRSWHPSGNIHAAFGALFDRFRESKLVISYRNDGYPSIEDLVELLRTTHSEVKVQDIGDYKYALSSRRTETKEVVLLARPRTKTLRVSGISLSPRPNLGKLASREST